MPGSIRVLGFITIGLWILVFAFAWTVASAGQVGAVIVAVVLLQIGLLLFLGRYYEDRGVRLTSIPPKEDRDRARTNLMLSAWFRSRVRVGERYPAIESKSDDMPAWKARKAQRQEPKQ